jgi:ribosomal protein L30/L7E
MVQISSALVAFILVAPSLAIPVSTQQEFEARAEELAVREPSFKSVFNKIKNFVTKKNVHNAERKVEGVINKVGKVADIVLREELSDLSERDLEDLDELLEREFDDEVDVFDRDLANVDFEDLAARYPSFGSIFRKIRKIASPKNLGTAAKIASFVVREEDLLTEREFAQLEELAEREPSFGSFFRKVKHAVGKVVNPTNIGRVAKVASYVIREDGEDVVERDLTTVDFEDLAARHPSFGSIFRKIRKIASPKNLGTAAKIASFVVREEDLLTEREFAQLEELAEREPSFGSLFRKVKHAVGKVVNPTNIGRVAKIASYVVREDGEDVFERDYSDFEIDELD